MVIYGHGQKSWDTFALVGRFSIHTCLTRSPTPQITLDCINQFFKFLNSVGWGEEELQENFEKDALFSEDTQKWQKILNNALLSKGRLSRIAWTICDHRVSQDGLEGQRDCKQT